MIFEKTPLEIWLQVPVATEFPAFLSLIYERHEVLSLLYSLIALDTLGSQRNICKTAESTEINPDSTL